MVHVTSIDAGKSIWNIEGRAQMGSQGDDVKLIQYLLARASEASNYIPDQISGSSGITVSNVDGIWGSQTDVAQKWLEQNWKGNHTAVADGVIDVIPATGVLFGADSVHEYKFALLQYLYAVAINQSNNFLDGSEYMAGSPATIVMNMAGDGQCPSDLSYALQAAKNESQTWGGADGGSDGGSAAAGGGSGGSDGN
jgi:hypothetical protein